MADPVLTCQHCKARLDFGDGDARLSGSGSGQLSARLEESFMVLATASDGGNAARGHQQLAGGEGAAAPPARQLDESFVVLPHGRGPPPSRGAPPALSAHSEGGAGSVQRVPFDARFRALARVFELASEETGVELPVCVDCAAEVHREMEAQLGELQQEVAAYESALAQLEAEGAQPLEAAAFQREERRAREELQLEQQRLAEAERQLAAARGELAAVAELAEGVSGQEERYWHAFNDFQLRLRGHLEERDAVEQRLESAAASLATLQRTNVWHDAFRIWFDGACGTISGLRLGRTAQQAVEWDEINAAWGQAVLLLATLAKACGVTFRAHRLLPRGSYPRVADLRQGQPPQPHDLFGPVSKFLCASYDKAQVGFLACLKEFADWLVARGAADGGGQRFALPCAIEGDRVAGLTIRLLFNKDKSWTRALKHMLVDLKFVLKYALVLLDNRAVGGGGGGGGGGAPVASLQREDFAGAASAAAAATGTARARGGGVPARFAGPA